MLFTLAMRNIHRNKRRTFLTISMMTFGYVLFSFFVSLGDGAYNNIIETFIRERTGYIQIHARGYLETPKLNNTISNYENITSTLSTDSNLIYSYRVKSSALAFGEKKSLGVEVLGINPKLEAKLSTLAQRVTYGDYFKGSTVVIGKKIAKILNILVGDQLVLISQGADGSIANDLFIVGGILSSQQDSFDDNTVYMPLQAAQDFFCLNQRVHEVVITFKAKKDEYLMAEKLNKVLPSNLIANTWQEVEKDFFRAMQADRKGDSIGRMIFMFVVALGVLNTVLMSILERKKEFGVLKAIGTRPRTIFTMIILETTIMALLSIGIGAILSLIINGYFSVVGISFTPFEYGGMRFDKMLATLNLSCFIQPALTILISSTLVTLLPGIKAAKVSPVDAMRQQ